MKSEFLLAVTQLAAERNLPKEVVFNAVEAALLSAYRKDEFWAQHNISVKIQPNSGDILVYALKTVVDKPSNTCHEVSLAAARKIKEDAQLGEVIPTRVNPPNAGRIAAQVAKQVVIQRLREAERDLVLGEFANKEGGIVSGTVQRLEFGQIIINLSKAEGILPPQEQVQSEHYHIGQRLKLYLLAVEQINKGPRLLLSRSHPNLVRCLFELEVPEIQNGLVVIKAIAREPGSRTKIAVVARQEGIDPVGSCIGLRGLRIQNIVNELQGEKIDITQWHHEPKVFISNALSPARVLGIEVNEAEKSAVVVVPDGQLSLAIGKEGQNARLAAKLTGWDIDIKSASAIEQEKAMKATEAIEVSAEEEIAPVAVAEEQTLVKPQIRFAEDILVPAAKAEAKTKKEKRKRPEIKEVEIKPKKKVKLEAQTKTIEEEDY
jgi:N utilization substance protein A